MPGTQSEAQLRIWRVPECPFEIAYSPAVLEEIRRAVVDAFYRLSRGGVEIGGVLFGTRETGHVEILACQPIECEHATGPSFVLSENDRERLAALLKQAVQDPRLRGLEPVGWYHSHTRSDIFLSGADLEIYNRYFPEPWQVALVLRPFPTGPTRAGFFFREADGAVRAQSSYREFALDLGAPGPGMEAPSAGETRSRPDIPRWISAVVVICMVAAGGAIVGSRRWTPGPAAQQPANVADFGLEALDMDGQLQIRWNHAAPAVQRARSGTLEITDGAAKTVVPLDSGQLRGGSFTYARQGARVDVRMSLLDAHGKTAELFTSFLGGPPPPKPAPPDLSSRLDDAQHERDSLAREAERLRAELRNEAARNRQLERALDQMRALLRHEAERNRK